MSKFTELFPSLVECFVIILFGYLSGRLNIVTPKQAEGIGKFVGLFALPALLFKSMVELDFGSVSWAFMVAVLLGKAIVFFIVLGFSLILIKPTAVGRGALYAIFTTQSNDFALGYPLIQALYSKTHPEFLQYIYLVSPISILILNPIGFVLLEIDKYRSREQEYMILDDNSHEEDESLQVGEEINVVDEDLIEDDHNPKSDDVEPLEREDHFNAKSCLNVVKGVLLNPLVFMVLIGLAGHFVFRGNLPNIIKNTLTTIGNAFSSAALFYLGLTMVGKISKQKGIGLIIPASLIAAKIVLLPILIRELILAFSNVLPVYCPEDLDRNSTNMTDYIYSLANFGYLYGTFPTAPTIVIYAARYGVELDRLAAGMVFCTSLSAPIMYISAWTLTMTRMSSDFFQKEVREVNKDISIITLFCSLWCIVIFIIGRKFLKVPHIVTLSYIFALFFSSLGTILWDSFGDASNNSTQLFLFGMMFFGVKSARIFTASIALSLVAISLKGRRWMWNQSAWFIFTPFFVSFLITIVMMTSAEMQSATTVGVFAYGQAQDITSFIIITLSLLITVVCLIVLLKTKKSKDTEETSSSPLLPLSNTELSCSDSDSDTQHDEQKVFCVFKTRCRSGDIQKVRHIVLLLLLSLSMFIGICLVLWKLTGKSQIGIYFEVAFLDSVFNFGQGFVVFCVFGLDSDLIIDPFVRLYRKLRYGSADISLPDLNTVDNVALHQCLQFTRYHLDDCKLEIVGERRSGLTVYPDIFTGTELCTWLVDRGLVNDRSEAVIYGQHLLLGRVIYHHSKKHYFHDHKYLYKFEEPKTCYRITRTNLSNSGLNSPAVVLSPAAHNVPSTSNSLAIAPSPMRTVSPLRKWYHGYSFEAHISTSEMESLTGSLKRHLKNRLHSSRLVDDSGSRDNNSNLSDSSLPEDISSHDRMTKRKPLKKILPKSNREKTDNASDSSF